VLTSFSARNFRCFEDLHVGDLARVNLVTGRNSTGKTSLLEAIFLLIGGGKLTLVMNLSGLRGYGEVVHGSPDALREIYWRPLFNTFSPGATIELAAAHARLGTMTLSVRPVTDEQHLWSGTEPSEEGLAIDGLAATRRSLATPSSMAMWASTGCCPSR
jgi:predicted ATPase